MFGVQGGGRDGGSCDDDGYGDYNDNVSTLLGLSKIRLMK